MRDRYPAGVRRLPFTGAAIAGAIMMIVGIALPAQRHVSIAGAGILFLTPFAEFLKDPANRRAPSGRASGNAGR